MKIFLSARLILLAQLSAFGQDAPATPERISLWANYAPIGGGLVIGAEGHDITGVVLEYRLPKGKAFVPLLDAPRAIRTVRSRATQWGIDPKRIGIVGFSVGGHGLNGYKGPMWDAWQAQSLEWLAAQKFIPAADAAPTK